MTDEEQYNLSYSDCVHVPYRSPEYLKERNQMINGASVSLMDLYSFEPFAKLAAKKTKENIKRKSVGKWYFKDERKLHFNPVNENRE